MPDITLTAEPRLERGSRASRRSRAAGKVPAVIYGHGVDAISVAVDGRELQQVLSSEAGLNALLTLEVGADRHLAMARDLQRHPIRGNLLHVDFQIVRRDEQVISEVPVSLVGDAIEVHRAGGLVEQQMFAMSVRAVPGRIPHVFEVDVHAMTIGGSIRVGDVPVPEGVLLEADPDLVVVVAKPPVVSTSAAVEEAAPETAGTTPLAAGGRDASTGSSGSATDAAGSSSGAES